jgi:hypothetical protein
MNRDSVDVVRKREEKLVEWSLYDKETYLRSVVQQTENDSIVCTVLERKMEITMSISIP